MRMGAAEFGPLATAWLRVCIATLMLFPLMVWQGHFSVFKANWKLVLGFGVINSALPFALYAYAVMHISTGLSAILNASVPLSAALVAWLWLGDRLNRWRIVGLIVGFVLGCISGFANLIKLTNRLAARDEAAKHAADSALDGTSSKQ
jgi:drug/metabolite transporter (DMT)-like permease